MLRQTYVVSWGLKSCVKSCREDSLEHNDFQTEMPNNPTNLHSLSLSLKPFEQSWLLHTQTNSWAWQCNWS
jgi:hypothetical protein